MERLYHVHFGYYFQERTVAISGPTKTLPKSMYLYNFIKYNMLSNFRLVKCYDSTR